MIHSPDGTFHSSLPPASRRGQIQHAPARDRLSGGVRLRRGLHEFAVEAVLGIQTVNGIGFRIRRKCEHGDVAIEVEPGGRLRQDAIEERRALNALFAGDDALHSVFGGVPRPAAAGPAGAVVHADFESQPVRFPDRMGKLEGRATPG